MKWVCEMDFCEHRAKTVKWIFENQKVKWIFETVKWIFVNESAKNHKKSQKKLQNRRKGAEMLGFLMKDLKRQKGALQSRKWKGAESRTNSQYLAIGASAAK